MDDKFLYQLREQPDLKFVNNLRKNLTQIQSAPKLKTNINFQGFSMNKKNNLAWVSTLVILSLIALVTISPARAFVLSFLTRIAGQSFEVTEDYPGDNYPGDVTIIEPQTLSLTESIALFPHSISLPTNLPNDFTLDENNVSVYTGKNAGFLADTIEIRWKSSIGALILNISNRDPSTQSEIVAPDSIEEILIDDQHSAVLIKGGWDADKKIWNNDMGILRLRWQLDDLVYDLQGNTKNITVEQLVVIALSTFE